MRIISRGRRIALFMHGNEAGVQGNKNGMLRAATDLLQLFSMGILLLAGVQLRFLTYSRF